MNLTELQDQYRQLYSEFLPTINHYSEMAKRALDLQIEIARLRLQEAFPQAKHHKENIVTTFTAREKPDAIEKVIAEIQKQGITISSVAYDTRTFTYVLFSKP
jgi:hypothetical protein